MLLLPGPIVRDVIRILLEFIQKIIIVAVKPSHE
jgi:hypothetical protein